MSTDDATLPAAPKIHGVAPHLLVVRAPYYQTVVDGLTAGAERILREAAQPGESTSETLRRALRLLDHERWLAQFRTDAEALKGEDVNTEPEAW